MENTINYSPHGFICAGQRFLDSCLMSLPVWKTLVIVTDYFQTLCDNSVN